MKVIQTTILGVVIIEPTVHSDKRGYFFESFKTSDFQEHGLPTHFVQDNQAKSTKGVLRGLHYQYPTWQGKHDDLTLRGYVGDLHCHLNLGNLVSWQVLLILAVGHHGLIDILLYRPPEDIVPIIAPDVSQSGAPVTQSENAYSCHIRRTSGPTCPL